MPRRASKAGKQPSIIDAKIRRPPHGEEMNRELTETVALGVGSRSRLQDKGQELAAHYRPRGLLPVPPEVRAEIKRQERQHPMTPEYRKTLGDRLTLQHYFSDVEVAFRRTPHGIEVLAAGLDEIAELRRTSTREERQGVVYGVG